MDIKTLLHNLREEVSETMSSRTYDKCHYFVVKASGLADDEETKFNHRRTKYYYVLNPNVVKKVIILSVLH